MKVQIYNIQANFYQDASSMGDMSPFILFDGDDDQKMDKRGLHSGKTDVAKKAGAGQVSWDDRVELHLKGNNLKVQGKASKALLPDKVLGEGQVMVGNGGRQQVQLTDPKTGTVVGEVAFEVTSGGGLTGGGMTGGAGGMGTNQGYNTGAGQTGQGYGAGAGTGAGVGAGQQGYNTGGQGYDNTTGGQGYGGNQGGQMVGGGQQGYGNQGGTGGGLGTGTGTSGMRGGPQEQYEKTAHDKHDHDESESHEKRTVM